MYVEAFALSDSRSGELPDWKLIRSKYRLRRADRYAALCVAAAAGLAAQRELAADCGLITLSAFGPHRTTFDTLDDILDYPEDQILPTTFSHSVHNAAASYIGEVFGLKGPVFALAGFESLWFEAFELAETLLASGMCRKVLLVAVEERALLTESAHRFLPERFEADPPEGAAVVLLSDDASDNRLGRIELCREAEPEERGAFFFGAAPSELVALGSGSPELRVVLKRNF